MSGMGLEELKALFQKFKCILRLSNFIKAVLSSFHQDQLRLDTVTLEFVICLLRQPCRHQLVFGAVDEKGGREVTLGELRNGVNAIIVAVSYNRLQLCSLS